MTEREKDAILDGKIRKSNELIQRARYKLSIPGQKILLYLISRIKAEDTEFNLEEFVISDFCELCSIDDSGGNYQILKDALSDLLTDSARVWITLENGRETPLHWIDWPEIDPESGRLMVKLADVMRPYLLNLKKNFTQYEMIYTMRFKSKYSFRLYEICKSFQYHDDKNFTKVYTVDELRNLLDAGRYDKYCDFNKRVLKTSVEEINKCTDKNLQVREIKRGRKVIQLELIISAKQGKELDELRERIGAPRKRKQRQATTSAESDPRTVTRTSANRSRLPGAERNHLGNDEAKVETLRRLYEHMQRQQN